MEGLKTFHLFALLLATLSVISVNGQLTTPCTTSMISSFTPCLNFITGSTSNGVTTPTQNCCDSLKSLMSTSMDCACLVITANVPLQLPINRTLSLSLPRACNMGGVPVQCKASGTPLPAPGCLPSFGTNMLTKTSLAGPAALFGPAPAPIADSPLSPRASKAVAPAAETDTTEDLTPASPPVESDAPTSPGISPALTPPPSPSASRRSCIPPPSLLLFFVGIRRFRDAPNHRPIFCVCLYGP
ncbi:hypothetical protein CISIN_1g038771mg [Citrus sinensis]|uniref:Bifunctional inhibitor/plant lipid transfer protein/seed storage helical domain-containing protein n=1 Tax=Citrus sinensis TaxID=2711 RepID=A0A067FMV8_CITSI|nr:hypothetical protein CISIN_1g038771mg [Citrus sinensis]